VGFVNPILGGGGALVRPAIKSPNYSPGLAGWTIKRDGSAELNNVVIRGGTVVSGLALYYNGTPATGNLIMSISAAAGVDSFGNAYVKGVGLYGTSGTLTAKDSAGNATLLSGNVGGGGVLSALPGLAFQLASNTGDPASIGGLDDGSHANLALLLTSPSPVVGGLPGTNFAQIYMVGADSGPTMIAMDAANVQVNSGAFNINSSGEIDTYGFNTTHSFVPAVGNAGTATWTTRSGYWLRLGPLRFVNINLVVNAAGSGAGIVTVTLPFNVERTLRQTITMHTESVGPNGSHVGDGECVFFAGGGGAVSDRLRTSSNDGTNRDLNLTGADLLAGGSITIQGWVLAG
jgi:hypothetical protein